MNNIACPYGTVTLYRVPFQVLPVHFAFNIVVLQPQQCRNIIGLG